MLTKAGRKRGFDFKEPAAANKVLQAATNFYSRREQFIPCLRGYHMIATKKKQEEVNTKNENKQKNKQTNKAKAKHSLLENKPKTREI